MFIDSRAALAARHNPMFSTALSAGEFEINTRDMMFEFDQQTRDSTGAFLIGELERLDQRLNEPLVSVTWGRDIDIRTDVTVADDVSSFLNSTFGATGGLEPGGINWIGSASNAIPGPALDIGKTPQPLHLWGMELSWTLPELAKSVALGRPIDTAKFNAMQLKHAMDTDQMVYVGDPKLNAYGLLNSPLVTVTNAMGTGANGATAWSTKDFNAMLADVNLLINGAWQASAYSLAPSTLLLPPIQYSKLVSQLVGTAGSSSILKFLSENSLSNQINGAPLRIFPVKWLAGRGVGGTDRAVVYTKNEERVRYPMTALQRTPVEYRSLYQMTTYWGRLGQVEWPYPETAAYMDGI